jgi:surface antigen
LATQVESPKVLTHAASQKITARSRRNTVVIAALIGLMLGALAALLWDSVAARLMPRNGE